MQTRSVRVRPIDLAIDVDGVAGVLINLSVTGLLVRTPSAIPVGHRVSLRLAGGLHAVVLNADVRRTTCDEANDHSIALEFVGMSPVDRLAIPRMVSTSTAPPEPRH
jgi:hypothetical protein